MVAASKENLLNLTVEMQHDGNYWVATCRELGMVAAHQKESVAWIRATRMVVSQIIYALNNDPTLRGLSPDDTSETVKVLRGFTHSRESFMLRLIQEQKGEERCRMEVPDLAAC